MPLKKFAALPTARMQIFYTISRLKDVAILDHSTGGHSVYHCGQLPYVGFSDHRDNVFCTQISDVEIALGDHSKLTAAVKEIVAAGYRDLFIMPSSLAGVLGLDLESFAADLSEEFSVNVFTCGGSLNDDFYRGSQAIMYRLAQCCRPAEERVGFNLLGGLDEQDAADHRYLARLIERATGERLVFDNMAADSLPQWKRASCAKLNVVTSKYALKTAEWLQKQCGVPYLCVRILGKQSQDRALSEIACALDRTFAVQPDAVYERVCGQFKNILEYTRPNIVCYADTDRLSALRSFFGEIGYEAEYVCSHAGGDFPYMEINEFAERHRDRLILSYDCMGHCAPHTLPLIAAGLDYRLLVPLPDAFCGQEGAYRLMKRIAETLF